MVGGKRMSELKLCPFCEGEAEIKGRACYWIECGKCFTTTDMYKTVEQAIDAWNIRANEKDNDANE